MNNPNKRNTRRDTKGARVLQVTGGGLLPPGLLGALLVCCNAPVNRALGYKFGALVREGYNQRLRVAS